MTKQIISKKTYYRLEKIEEVISLSKILREHIIKHNLFTNISGKNYVQVEGWQFAGGLLGLTPIITAVERVASEGEIKYMATCEIIDKNGQVVGRGFAICSNKESKKKTFDEYAVLSMAQTRCLGKAYRNKIGWIMKLAGYDTTPAEEMVNAEVAKDQRESNIESVIKTIASMKTLDNLEHLKTNLNSKKKDFSKEEQNLIRKALNEKENELSVSSA